MQEAKAEPIKYSDGMFEKYLNEPNFEHWDGFPETMWGLGYEMDLGKSFNSYLENCNLNLKPANNERERRRNILYALEHAERQIVGNYLLSYWRFLTHWAMGGSKYDPDFLCRIIKILEQKYKE